METVVEIVVTLAVGLVRRLWLPALVIVVIAYVILPAITVIAQALVSPAGLLVVALLFLWLRRR